MSLDALFGALVGGTASLLGTWISLRHQARSAVASEAREARRRVYETVTTEFAAIARMEQHGHPEAAVRLSSVMERLSLYAGPEVQRAATDLYLYFRGLAQTGQADNERLIELNHALSSCMRTELGLDPVELRNVGRPA